MHSLHTLCTVTQINVSFKPMYTSVPMDTNYFLRRRDVRLYIYNKPTSRRIENHLVVLIFCDIILKWISNLCFTVGRSASGFHQNHPSPHDKSFIDFGQTVTPFGCRSLFIHPLISITWNITWAAKCPTVSITADFSFTNYMYNYLITIISHNNYLS